MKKLFTPDYVASLQPQATRYEVFDKQLAGFAVRVSTNGRLVWYVQKRYTAADLSSKVHKEVLGDTTTMSLDEARSRALEVITALQTLPKRQGACVQKHLTVAFIYDTYRSERKLCTHYAALTDSVEWLHNMHKRHGETAVFFTRDFTQQRPVDTATTFKAYRAKRWLEMLQAEEIMKANLDGTLRSFMDIVSSKKLDPVAVFDHLAELYASKNPTLTSEGGSDATQKG